MKSKIVLHSILASICLTGSFAMADTATMTDEKQPQTNKVNPAQAAKQKSSSNKIINSYEQQQKSLLQAANRDVLEGFNKIREAIHLLRTNGKEKEAIVALEVATGKFDTALTDDPALNLVPIDTDINASEFLGTAKMINYNIGIAIDALKNHRVQDARMLLMEMKDEMVLTTVYLPMDTYPVVIKQATKALTEGNKKEAMIILDDGFSTFIVDTTMVPLALLRAESSLDLASTLDKFKDKAKIKVHLNSAIDQLKIATSLGYTDKHSLAYEDLNNQIKELNKEIDGDNDVERLYKKIQTSFKELIEKHKASKQKVEK